MKKLTEAWLMAAKDDLDVPISSGAVQNNH
jgi:hypothetical protein